VRVKAGSARMEALPLGAPANEPLQPTPIYQAASLGRRLASWRPGTPGPNSTVQASGPDLVRRSRDLRRNNPHAKRAMDLISTHVVGTGIKPRSLCTNRKVREALTELWADWTRVADADGVLDFYGMQALLVDEMVEGGEAFVRLRPRRVTDGLPVPFQLQALPTEMIPLDYNQPNGTNSVSQGIERDALGRRAAYWAYPRHPSEWVGSQFGVDMTPKPIPAGDVCHLFNVARIGQARGLPWLAAAMTTLHQVAQYQDAELLRKQMAAAIVGFVKKAYAGDVSAEEMAAEWGKVRDQMGDLPAVALEPGTMQYLEPGEDVEFNTPADVGGSYEPFLASNYRAVAAAGGVLYEELTGDWKNANDRTFRAQFETFKRSARQWQWNLVCAQFNDPVWRRFVSFAVASGAIKVPKSVSDADLYRVEHRPERWAYLNAKQDIEAIGSEMALGLTSRAGAIAERGDDIEVIDQQRSDDREREARMGLPVPGAAAAEPEPLDLPAS
jgi:lambda family phage portal protein